MSRYIFEQLDTADQALRENLHRNDLDPTARSVQRLVGDLEKVNHIVAKVRRRERPAVISKSIRV